MKGKILSPVIKSHLGGELAPTTRRFADVINRLIELCIRGSLTPGERLPSERSLSNQFKVSRASLREAITALEVAGIVLVKPGNGIFLSENVLENIFKISDISASFSPLEILEARSLIEPNIAGLAAERRAHKDLASLREANELMEFRLNEDLDSWDADWGFHEALVKATQNLSLYEILKNFQEQMNSPVWALIRARNLKRDNHGKKYLQEHKLIFNSIQDKNSEEAISLMQTHLLHVNQDLDEIYVDEVKKIEKIKK